MTVTAPAELHRVVLVRGQQWQHLAAYAHIRGLALEPVPAGPGQAPRYLLSGNDPRATARPRGDLSQRELQVLILIACGNTNGEIGRHLYLSEDTIKNHTRRLFAKLGARDRAHAVAIGYDLGLLGGAL